MNQSRQQVKSSEITNFKSKQNIEEDFATFPKEKGNKENRDSAR